MPGQAQTIKDRKCIQQKMSIEGMSQSEAAAACGIQSQGQATKTGVRLAKKKGGAVQARPAAKKKAVKKAPAKKAVVKKRAAKGCGGKAKK